ncbi:hypothetical protein PORCRE_498 [Porphyromonas crevioricanis JCM 15906]|uniref:Uncharacterized protein n=1 Tax=Porphyromonas crevioricanis JCM 15906 TaxID=1305617 RepID=T1CM86_9PORP|nr:hypothetical protein PORCRE_498 [Porphyromonas crevioricanis JCM 15906]
MSLHCDLDHLINKQQQQDKQGRIPALPMPFISHFFSLSLASILKVA